MSGLSSERPAPPRRVWERAVPIIILFVLAGTILAFCGDGGDSRLDTADDLGRAAATSRPNQAPFELPEADGAGRTTLPNSYFDEGTVAPGEPTVTAPTTTLPPLDAPVGDPVCQGALILGNMFRVGEQIKGDVVEVRTFAAEQLRAASHQFAVAGGAYAPGAAFLATRADMVEKVDREDEIGPLVKSIRLMDDPVLAPLVGELTAHLAQACPSLSQG